MSAHGSCVFLGADLGWYGKPTGLASIETNGNGLSLRKVTRLEDPDEILSWIGAEAGDRTAVVGVDAPLVICNQTGIRDAERELNHEFRRFHAGCHAANLGRPFAPNVLAFSGRLNELGFVHGTGMAARQKGRFQRGRRVAFRLKSTRTLRRLVSSIFHVL